MAEIWSVELPEQRVRELRARLEETLAKRAGTARQNLWPPPRIDGAFELALRRLQAEERAEIPEGTVILTEHDKQSLREPGDRG